MAKDGALVVWECSMTLTEMQDYIKKTTITMKDKEEEEGEEEGEEGEEGEEEVEQMIAGDEKSDSNVGSEDSDEEEAVSMETVAMVTSLGRRKGDSDGEQDGKYYHKLVPCSHGNSEIVSLSCRPPGALK